METPNTLGSLAGVMLLAALAACSAPALESSSTGITQTATATGTDSTTPTPVADRSWVVFAADHTEDMGIASWLLETDGFWTPSVDDVQELEDKLAEYLSQNAYFFSHQPPVWERLDAYQRQYIGLERGGRLIIYGNYFCTSGGINWRQQLVSVEDGGECYFQLEYDMDSDSFTNLWVNGEA